MRRKSVLMAIGILILAACAILGILALMARHEPKFYVDAGVKPGPVRQAQSGTFLTECSKIINGINNHEMVWRVNFTEAQLNSFFEEDFINSRVAKSLLPEGVSAPRVVLEHDKIRLAFRYGSPPWSTVISIDFRIWLAPKQYNVVVLELQSLHAGALPVSAQSLLDQIWDGLRRHGIEVNWYRHEGHPVAVLRFGPDQARPSVQLKRLEVRNGALTIVGGSVESSPSPVAGRQASSPTAANTPPLGN